MISILDNQSIQTGTHGVVFHAFTKCRVFRNNEAIETWFGATIYIEAILAGNQATVKPRILRDDFLHSAAKILDRRRALIKCYC